MLDSLAFVVREGQLIVSVVGADNVRKAILTSEERPWVNLTRADITLIKALIEKRLKAANK